MSRRQILLGKWLGFVGMITIYVALMVGGVVLVLLLADQRPHPAQSDVWSQPDLA